VDYGRLTMDGRFRLVVGPNPHAGAGIDGDWRTLPGEIREMVGFETELNLRPR
jgi:hypothetical protein